MRKGGNTHKRRDGFLLTLFPETNYEWEANEGEGKLGFGHFRLPEKYANKSSRWNLALRKITAVSNLDAHCKASVEWSARILGRVSVLQVGWNVALFVARNYSS